MGNGNDQLVMGRFELVNRYIGYLFTVHDPNSQRLESS